MREGANQALNRLVAYLQDNHGHQVRVYSPIGEKPAFEPAGTLVPVPSIRLPIRNEFRLALGLPRAIRHDMMNFAPDLVHVSTPDILDTRAQSFAKQLNVPIVASMHTLFETYLEHYRLGWARPIAEAHLRRFYRRSDHVLTPTAALAAEMMRMRGDDHASVWSRGIDRQHFNPDRRDLDMRRSMGFANEDIVILFFGRLVLEKGVRIFVEAVRMLQEAGAPVRPLVVGAGPAAGRFGALSGGVMTGHLEGVDLDRAIASADIMLTPSLTETFGNVVLEAMASGLAVVSADAPSARSLLIDRKTGILCDPLNAADYADKITLLIDAPEYRMEMGAAARRASAAFSWDAASESVAQVYEKVLQRR
ncbi:MAG: glycosyltransferase family 1 protein [Sphingosinicella sp.]|nr:glycosyltransferase family 1 protein [Sphingosinicella sp.]